MSPAPLRLGILTNELFDPALGGIGGFGWAARTVASIFSAAPELGVEPLLLSPRQHELAPALYAQLDGTLVVVQRGNRVGYIRSVRRERLDLLLSIDYRPGYFPILAALPRTPLIVWARDPRSPADAAKVGTLRIPGEEESTPRGVEPIDCTSLGKVVRASRLFGRRVVFAAPAVFIWAVENVWTARRRDAAPSG